nr:MAG TPA: hypothetical protein [Caudoviricetes sp.]
MKFSSQIFNGEFHRIAPSIGRYLPRILLLSISVSKYFHSFLLQLEEICLYCLSC